MTRDSRLARHCYRTVTTTQCQGASLCVHPQLCTTFVNVCAADLKSHLLCWMLESLVRDMEVASAHPVCTGMVTLFPVSQSSTSSAVMPGCHLCITIALEVVSQMTTMAFTAPCAQHHSKRHSISDGVSQQCPTKQGQVQILKLRIGKMSGLLI